MKKQIEVRLSPLDFKKRQVDECHSDWCLNDIEWDLDILGVPLEENNVRVEISNLKSSDKPGLLSVKWDDANGFQYETKTRFMEKVRALLKRKTFSFEEAECQKYNSFINHSEFISTDGRTKICFSDDVVGCGLSSLDACEYIPRIVVDGVMVEGVTHTWYEFDDIGYEYSNYSTITMSPELKEQLLKKKFWRVH